MSRSPVGELTDAYRELADTASIAVERHGGMVRRAYSPDATPEQVLAAIDGADIVVYFGHGTGYPNPYSTTLNPEAANGWGLQGPKARGTHDDSLADGSLAYFGEAWIARHAMPAPGFVMIYSNVCYAPGAGEGHDAPSTPEVAAQRAGHYSRTPLAMGASAVFATDFYLGAATLVDTLLGSPATPYGEVFAADPRFEPDALTNLAHPYAAPGNELWLHRSRYFDGKLDYWYAFAGDPAASFAGAGSGLSRPRSYDPVRAGMLRAGRLELVRFAADGSVTERKVLEPTAASAVSFSARQRHASDDAMWLELAAPEAGWWVVESPAAYVAGIAAQSALAPARRLELAPGTHPGHAFDASGAATASATITLTQATSWVADAEALINGQRHLRVRDGQLAGLWVQASQAVQLGAVVIEQPGPAAGASSPAPSPTASATPRPLPSGPPGGGPPSTVLPPPAPPAPTPATPAPSSVESPAPSPTPSPSATDTAAPSAPASATPSAEPTPSVTPTPTPIPAGG
jgi:hypothetical protein